jgi:hypothetical protein
MGRLLRLDCSGAFIRTSGRGNAYVWKDGANSAQRIMVSLAGAIGEEFSGVSVPRADGIDRARVRQIMRDHNISWMRLHRLQRIVRAKLERNRDRLGRVAMALLKYRRLTGSEIDRLMENSDG